jgi:hypothetical protein
VASSCPASSFIDIGARNGHTCSIGDRSSRCDLFTSEHKFYLALNDDAPRVSSWTVLPQMIPGSRYGLTLLGQLF